MRATLMMLCVCLVVPTRAAEDKTVQELTDKLIKAAGGEAKLKDAGACTLKFSGQIDVAELNVPIEGNWSLRGLDRFRWDGKATVQGKTQNGGVLVHGDKAWLINNEGKENAHFTKMKGLRDDKQHLQLDLSEIKVETTLDDSIFALPPK